MADNEILDCLIRLQDVLQNKFELEKQVEVLPANLREEEKKFRDANQKYLLLTEKYNSVNDELKSLSIRYDDAFKSRTEYEKQMEFINTQREYEALYKQLEEAKLQEQVLLKSRNAKKAELSNLSAELDAEEKNLDEQKAIVEAEHAKVDATLDRIYAGIDELNAQCEEIKGNVISPELYEKFCNISKQKDGIGIVPIHGQVCSGCDMVLPMQFVIDTRMKQLHSEIEYCPYCSRIIWYEKLDPEVEKNYIFEQLEPTKTDGGKATAQKTTSESDSFDESMGMDEGFEDF